MVYAFLSPVPMSALWAKAVREMRPGCWLISNSFEISRATPANIVSVGDRRNTHLYCYRIPGAQTAKVGQLSRISHRFLP